MPDPLYAAIASAIRQPLDGATFERCAVDLLRDAHYPGLRGTPHNNDTGIDGLSGPDDAPEFGLVATAAKDYRRNLRENVRSHLDAGGAARAFVLATTQEVTVKSRQSLMQEAEKQRVRLLAIHDRGDFEQLLYRSPEWRKELLGVTGSAQALSRFPASPRPSVPIPLIGRAADLARLRAEDGDIVLAGKPGVGKTFLLEHLADEDWGLFDLGWSVSELKDAVLGMRPRRVVLDDAHLSPDRIPAVRQMRRETEADFSVVAVSWPGRADEVAALLPDAERIDVEELERDRTVEVIEAAGVAGLEKLQSLIADQTRGRAGLAVTLARACLSGGGEEVVRGERLLSDLAAWYRRTLGYESHQVLGVLALAGDAGATLDQISTILGLGLPQTSNFVRGLAAGGIIDDAKRPLPLRLRWLCVQPEVLRYALVADVFYGDHGSLNPVGAVKHLDPPSITAIPLIGAAHRGANVDRGWLSGLVDWTDERVVAAYARLGPDELRTALYRAPIHRRHIAETAYAAGVDQELALRVLLELATDAGSAAPLRIVADYLASPRERMEARRLAVRAADAWLRDGGDAHAGYRVLAHAVNPEWSERSIDPKFGKDMTTIQAVPSPDTVDEMKDLWDSILVIAERDQDIPVTVVLDALRPWVHPGSIGRRSGPDNETAAAMRRVAVRVIRRLADIFRERPGVLYRLQKDAERGDLLVDVRAPDWFASLFPEWENVEEGEVFVQRAEEIAGRPAAEVAGMLMLIDREARLAGIEERGEMMPRGARRLARELAVRDDRPEEMLAELERRGADTGLLGQFLDRAAELQRPGWEEAVERLLGSDATAGAAIRTALVRPAGERLKRLAIGRAAPWLGLIEALVLRDEIDDATLALLFGAPDPRVAREAALTLGAANEVRAGRIGRLASSLIEHWKEIVASVPPDGDGASGAWRLARVLEADHALCANWLRTQFASLRDQESREQHFIDSEVALVIEGLPSDVRTELIADVPSGVSPFLLERYVLSLLAGNIKATKALFGRADLSAVHRIALQRIPSENPPQPPVPLQGAPSLRDDPPRPPTSQVRDQDATATQGIARPANKTWMERALLAMDHGWTPERIVSALQTDSWWGDESEHWQGMIAMFESLRPAPGQPDASRRDRIVAAGIAYFGKPHDRAKRAERDARVFGSER